MVDFTKYIFTDCAWDSKYYEVTGSTFNGGCSQNGNYEPLQQNQNGKYYCVDSDGFPKSDFSDVPEDCSLYY